MMIGKFYSTARYFRIGCQNTHGSFHCYGFTGAGLTNDRNCLALHQVNIDSTDGVHASCSRLKRNIQVPYF